MALTLRSLILADHRLVPPGLMDRAARFLMRALSPTVPLLALPAVALHSPRPQVVPRLSLPAVYIPAL